MSRIAASGAIAFSCFALLFSGCGSSEIPPSASADSSALDSAQFWSDHIVANPSDPEGYVGRAAWHLRQGRITEGLQDLNLALEADSTYAPAWSAKADALYLTQAFEPCIAHLDACLEVSPSYIPCLLRRAEMHIHLGQFPEAFGRINDALRQDPFNHEAYWMKGVLYREQGNNVNARSSFQTAVEVNPNFFDGFIALGLACAADNDTLAIGYYTTAMELRPNSVEAKYNLAYFLQEHQPTNSRYLNRALALYKDIQRIDPTNAAAPFNRGYIQLEHFQAYALADDEFTQAIEALPHYHQAFFNRGLCHESLDELDQAELDYREALEIKPDYTAAALALGRVLRSQQEP